MMKRVDGIIPSPRPRNVRPVPGLSNNVPRLQRQPARSIDGVQSPHPKSKPVVRPAQAAQSPAPTKSRRKTSKLQTPLLVLAIVVGGFLIQQSAAVGELCIAAYTIVVLKQRVASRFTFILALIAFVGVLALLFFQANQTLAANFALYAFLLLAVAVLSLIRELMDTKSHA